MVLRKSWNLTKLVQLVSLNYECLGTLTVRLTETAINRLLPTLLLHHHEIEIELVSKGRRKNERGVELERTILKLLQTNQN